MDLRENDQLRLVLGTGRHRMGLSCFCPGSINRSPLTGCWGGGREVDRSACTQGLGWFRQMLKSRPMLGWEAGMY